MACRKADDPDQSNPEPDESLVLPCTPLYGTVRVDAWRGVHPLINGDRGYFAGWDGGLPVLRGTLLHVTVDHLPDGREPLKAMWLWHAGPAPLSTDELWRAYLARFDTKYAFKFAKGTPRLTASKVRPPHRPAAGRSSSWPRTPSCCSPAPSPPTCAAPGKNAQTPHAPYHPDGSAAGLPTSGPAWAPRPVSRNPPGPAPADQKAPSAAPHPATQC